MRQRGRSRDSRLAVKLASGALAASLVLLASCGEGGRGSEPMAVAERRTIQNVVEELGVVESTRVAQVAAPFRARIVSILENGTTVKAGETVAMLDTRTVTETLESRLEDLKRTKNELEAAVEDLMISLRSNALDLSSSQAQLDLARVELSDVNRQLSEIEYLKSRELVADDSVRRAQSNLRTREINTLSRDMVLRGDVTGSQSAESSKQTRLERIGLRGDKQLEEIKQAQDSINAAEIKAPVDGMFLRHSRWNWSMRRNVERQAGEQVDENELLGTIPDMNALIIRSQIPESKMLSVRVGTDVQLIFEALGNLQIPGRISYLAPLAIERETSAGGQAMAGGEELTGEKVFEVQVEMLGRDARLRPGLTARARIVTNSENDLLTVPIEAIHLHEGEYLLYVQGKNGVETRTVQIGQRDESRVEVLSGLAEGENFLLRVPEKIQI